MPRRSPPQIKPGELSRADAEALNEALRDLYKLVGGFSASAPLTLSEDQGGVSIRLDTNAVATAVTSGPGGIYPLPPAPTGLSAAAVSGSVVSLTFSINAGAVDGVAWYSTSETGPWLPGPEASSPILLTGLSPASTYWFLVTASNGTGGQGPWDGPVSATTMSVASHTTDSILVAGRTSTHTTDSILVGGHTATHTTDSILIGTRTAAHTTDSLLSVLRTVAHTTDSLLSVLRTNTHTTDSILVAGRTSAHTTDSYIHHALTGPATSPTAGSPTSSTISVGWTSPSGSTDANISQSTDGVTYTPVASAVTSPWTATGLSASTLYYFLIYALNADGDPSATAAGPVTATTTSGSGPTRTAAGTAAVTGGSNAQISGVTVPSGAMLVVGVGQDKNYPYSQPTVTFGSTSLTFQGNQGNAALSGDMNVMLFSGAISSGGTAKITVTGQSDNTGMTLVVASYYTGLTANVDDGVGTNNGGGGSHATISGGAYPNTDEASSAVVLFCNDASTSFTVDSSSTTGATMGQTVSQGTFHLVEAYLIATFNASISISLDPASTSYWTGVLDKLR